MSEPTATALTAGGLLAAAVATVAVGAYGVRLSRTTSDFLVASRTVGPRWNAAAISGEYLSAASFLGVAGLIAKYGADALWYPVGFTAGYLGLLLFVRPWWMPTCAVACMAVVAVWLWRRPEDSGECAPP